MRIFGLIMILIIIVLLIIYWIWLFISSGKIEQYKKNGSILENSIAVKEIIEINGEKNGVIIRGKSLDNPILLLVSSGPGTPDYFLNEAYKDMNLEDYYTICYWEYRNTCMVYNSKMDPNTVTTDVLIEDTKEISNYLRNRFNKDKIYILGFSGGSYIALNTIKKYPELFKAYFGMAQLVSKGIENDTLIYNYMKDTFTERNDLKRLEKLENLVEHIDEQNVKSNDWMKFIYLLHEAGGGTIKDKTELTSIVEPLLLSRCYTITEKINYLKGLKFYNKTILHDEIEVNDFRESVTKVDIPVYFISGEYDYNAPWLLVEKYCEMLDAPIKKFYKFSNSAHSPLWEEPENVVPILKKIADDLS